ncbi:hypothetical protein X975_04965, partial [Stegodyphus mimosarum]
MGRKSFRIVNAKCVCYICHGSVALPEKGNVGRHFESVHGSFNSDFPLKSELHKQRLKEFKSQLIRQQSYFIKTNTIPKAAIVASFRVSHVVAKHKVFADGEIINESFLEAND